MLDAMVWELAALALVLVTAYLWSDSVHVREHAVAAGRAACARYGVQFLDETVSFTRLRLARDEEGRVRLRRTYSRKRIPMPCCWGLGRIIYFLQAGSADVTELIFTITGIPHFREGFVFHLPGFSIEVASQCSGIRSSLAILITAVLASHFFLPAAWHRAVLMAAVLPVVLIKNGVRIAVLTFLALHVDKRTLTEGFLHQSGGFVFILPALVLMGAILYLLKR